MIKNIKNFLKASVLLLSGSFLMWNCESTSDNLGSQFFEGNASSGSKISFDVVAYNVNNNDSIRVDGSSLPIATLGAFYEPLFGLQKSHYVAQPRLSVYAPDFGVKPVVDSVVLELNPSHISDSLKTNTIASEMLNNVEVQRVVNTYPIEKYGKGKKPITLNIYEVTDFLGTSGMVFSDKKVNTGALLGSKTLNGTVSSVKITKKSDNSEVLSRDARIRIPLNKDFFQNKILAKSRQPELSDASSFIRYFRGIRISVPENDGYLMRLNPVDSKIMIYYKKDVTANGATTPTATSYAIHLGTQGTYFNQFEYDRNGTPSQAIQNSIKPNFVTGDAKLYAQGMGGSSIGLRLTDESIVKLRELYRTQKISIVSAKIRLYTDNTNLNYPKPVSFAVRYFDPSLMKRDLSTFLNDFSAFIPLGITDLVSNHTNVEPSYYEVLVTQSLKDIVKHSVAPKQMILDVGKFRNNANNTGLMGPSATERAFSRERVVLVGTDANNPNRAQLNVMYSSK